MQEDKVRDKELCFSEKRQVYILNFLMCVNGGVIAAFSYSCASMLASAITGGYVKLFDNLFLGNLPLAVGFAASSIVFIAGILLTIFLKHKLGDKRTINKITLLIISISYLAEIFINPQADSHITSAPMWLYHLLPIFFSSALQYNTFGYMDGIQPATMFVTNNVRQTFIRLIDSRIKHDAKMKKEGLLFLFSLLFFSLGLIIGFLLFPLLGVKVLVVSISICALGVLFS